MPGRKGRPHPLERQPQPARRVRRRASTTKGARKPTGGWRLAAVRKPAKR
jgi:hypothetical protein